MRTMGIGIGLTRQYSQIGAAITPVVTPVVTAVSVGLFADGSLPISVAATDVSNGDAIYWVLFPSANADPTAAQVRNGLQTGDAAPTESGNDVWPGPFSDTLISGITRGNYKLAVVIDDGALSNVFVSTAFEVDSDAPTLVTPTASVVSGDITWGVTSDQAEGNIYAAIRLAANAVLSSANIINGTGNAVATSTDASPTANAANGGTFTAPADGTYRVDMVQVDDYGNTSNVVTSTSDLTVGATAQVLTAVGTNAADDPAYGVAEVVDFTSVAANQWLLFAVVTSDGASGTNINGLTLETISATQFASPDVYTAARSRGAMFKMQCPAGAAGNATANILASVTGATPDVILRTFVWMCAKEPAVVQWNSETNNATTNTGTITGTTAGNPVVAAMSRRATGGTITGVTVEMTGTYSGTRGRAAGQNTNAGGGTVTITADGNANSILITAEIS